MKSFRTSVSRWEWLALAAIIAVSAALRLAYLHQFIADPSLRVPVVDAVFHDYWARGIVTGDWTTMRGCPNPLIAFTPFAKPPGYTYFLSAIYAAAGPSPILAVIAVQMAMGLLNVALTWWLARWLMGRACGLIAAAIMGGYWLLIYFEGELLDPALTITLTLLVALAVKRWLTHPRATAALLIGVLAGLLALVRSNYLPMIALLAVGATLAARKRLPARSVWGHAALVLLGAAAAILPVTLRNWTVGKEFVLISANGGINLYIGNNPKADLQTASFPELDKLLHTVGWSHFDDLAIVQAVEEKLGRKLGYNGVSRYFTGLALDYIRRHPGRTLSLTARRAARLLGPVEYSNNKVIALEREDSPLLRRLPGNFTMILALAVIGMLQWPPSPNKRRFIIFMLAYLLVLYLSYVLFFLEARFRIPMLPFLAIFAAMGIVKMSGLVARREWLPLAARLAAATAVYVALWWLTPGYKPDAAYYHLLRSTQYATVKNIDRCREEIEKSYQACSGRDPSVALQLARVYLAQGRGDDSIAMFERAVTLKRDFFDAYLDMGQALASLGRLERAQEAFQRALALHPDSAPARQGLEQVMGLRGLSPAEAQRVRDELAK
ncbi:tetratricopeptide repeat protein [bacterium]|nr:tetratricopeptide repeat protein [bacterium]